MNKSFTRKQVAFALRQAEGGTPVAEIIRQMAGYEDVNDAERLSVAPVKEGKNAVRWTRLSCHGFEANQVRLQLHVLANNLGNFVRRLALPASVKHWTLTTLRDKLIKIGAKVVHHARYVTFQLAEAAIPRRLYEAILTQIRRFAARPAKTVPS